MARQNMRFRLSVVKKDNEWLYVTHSFYSLEDFAKQLKVCNHFPMRSLGWKTPHQVLQDYFASL